MAVTYAGTKVQLTPTYVPVGYTPPTVAGVTSPEWLRKNVIFEVLKSTVEDADEVTTLTQLVAALDVDVAAYLNLVFDDATVASAHGVLTFVENNTGDQTAHANFYTLLAPSYKVKVDLYVETAA